MTAARLIDLSVPIDDVASERVPVRIRYFDHRDGARQMGTIFDVAPERWPDGLGWAGEEVTLITHAGTHMDAPSHYGPLTRGEPALAIDAVPLDWCYGPGLVLDLRHVPAGGAITVADLDAAARAAGREPAPGDIVLLMTGAAGAWGREEYPDAGCGLIRSSLIWLLDRGVRVIGTDAWGLDRPFQALRADLARTGDLDAVWAVHFYGRERAYCQLEKLTNLDRLPPTGFLVCCFPVKVARASAGWVRAVAILPNGDAADTRGVRGAAVPHDAPAANAAHATIEHATIAHDTREHEAPEHDALEYDAAARDEVAHHASAHDEAAHGEAAHNGARHDEAADDVPVRSVPVRERPERDMPVRKERGDA